MLAKNQHKFLVLFTGDAGKAFCLGKSVILWGRGGGRGQSLSPEEKRSTRNALQAFVHRCSHVQV
jgi:hypothetical protein